MFIISFYVNCFQKEKEEVTEEFLDWWSKFYASIGDEEKAGEYINEGYEKMTVSFELLICNLNINSPALYTSC